jgi:hypothetical protein
MRRISIRPSLSFLRFKSLCNRVLEGGFGCFGLFFRTTPCSASVSCFELVHVLNLLFDVDYSFI